MCRQLAKYVSDLLIEEILRLQTILFSLFGLLTHKHVKQYQ